MDQTKNFNRKLQFSEFIYYKSINFRKSNFKNSLVNVVNLVKIFY